MNPALKKNPPTFSYLVSHTYTYDDDDRRGVGHYYVDLFRPIKVSDMDYITDCIIEGIRKDHGRPGAITLILTSIFAFPVL